MRLGDEIFIGKNACRVWCRKSPLTDRAIWSGCVGLGSIHESMKRIGQPGNSCLRCLCQHLAFWYFVTSCSPELGPGLPSGR
jgi:hypothetical protein